jgi:hypothetical protein
MLVSRLAYCSALKMEVTCSSEMPVEFQRPVRSRIPGDKTVQDRSTPLGRCDRSAVHLLHENCSAAHTVCVSCGTTRLAETDKLPAAV